MGRPGLRARVLPDPARHLRDDSAGAHAGAGAVRRRGASSAPTPSSSAPCSARATTCASRCGCSTSARSSRSSRRNTPAPPPTRGSTRTRSPTRSTSSSARCAASRARSWRSPPTATASAWSGPVENRDVKEIYISDYDGANARRITTNRQLNITPSWSPDARAIAYTSYRRGYPDIFVALIYQGLQQEPTKGGTQNWLPMFSPDGTRIAFTSNRDGNPEIYVMNRDGSNVRRLTNHPAIDVDADLVADRHADRVHVRPRGHAADLHRRRRRPEPAPADDDRVVRRPADVVAGAVQRDRLRGAHRARATTSRSTTWRPAQTRQITFGEGTNESPAYSPNGRHLAFTSTRAGRVQIFTIGRDGRGVKQITRDGNNYTPSWSN